MHTAAAAAPTHPNRALEQVVAPAYEELKFHSSGGLGTAAALQDLLNTTSAPMELLTVSWHNSKGTDGRATRGCSQVVQVVTMTTGVAVGGWWFRLYCRGSGNVLRPLRLPEVECWPVDHPSRLRSSNARGSTQGGGHGAGCSHPCCGPSRGSLGKTWRELGSGAGEEGGGEERKNSTRKDGSHLDSCLESPM